MNQKYLNATNIPWTDYTWNPMTGCIKVSDGCKNCYAFELSESFKKKNFKKYHNGSTPTFHKYQTEMHLNNEENKSE